MLEESPIEINIFIMAISFADLRFHVAFNKKIIFT